jgi:hypothetical protein
LEVHLDAGPAVVSGDSALPLLLDRGDKGPFAGDAVKADARYSPDFLSLPTAPVQSLASLLQELEVSGRLHEEAAHPPCTWEAVVGLCDELSNTASEQVNLVPLLQAPLSASPYPSPLTASPVARGARGASRPRAPPPRQPFRRPPPRHHSTLSSPFCRRRVESDATIQS